MLKIDKDGKQTCQIGQFVSCATRIGIQLVKQDIDTISLAYGLKRDPSQSKNLDDTTILINYEKAIKNLIPQVKKSGPAVQTSGPENKNHSYKQ